MRKELVIVISLIVVFITSVVFADNLVIVDRFKDGWGKTHSCGYLKNTIKRKGAIVDVQIDRIDPNGTLRTWTKINCKTKSILYGKMKSENKYY